jgi:imidazolonepropionase
VSAATVPTKEITMPSATDPVVLLDATVATMNDAADLTHRRDDTVYGLVQDAAVVVSAGRIAWLGERADLPTPYRAIEPLSLGGGLVTPGLVECHAQVLFAEGRAAGNIARHRLAAEPNDTVQAIVASTRDSSDEQLLAAARRHAWWFIRQGVTTLELKTGYGLDPEGELRLLRLAAALRAELPIRTRITLLAGHAYPPGVDHEDYVIEICDELLPAAIDQGIFDSVEVYCEETAGITMEDASTILETVYRKKIPTRVAADHLSDSAGGALAPAFYAKLAAHLNFTDDIAVKAMGIAGTVAVLVPASSLELGEAAPLPPVAMLRQHHVPLAVATGFNPGDAPLCDPRAAAHLACALYGLSLPEALHGITSIAARALQVEDSAGTLAPDRPADLVVWDAEHPEDLGYWLSAPICREVWAQGRPLDIGGGPHR